MTNSEVVRQHKKRQRRRQQERRQLELEELLGRITPHLSESSLCSAAAAATAAATGNIHMIADMYQPIRTTTSLLLSASSPQRPILMTMEDFWSKVPDMCNPNAAVMNSHLTEAVDRQKLARDRRFQAKLQQKLESREQRGEISKEEHQNLWQQHGRRHKQKKTSSNDGANNGGDDGAEDGADDDDDDDSSSSTSSTTGDVVSLLSASRGQRKSWQVENFVVLLQGRLQPGMTVVDFGSGSGNLCLALAAYFPQVRFVLVDKNEYSLQLVQRRADASNLPNVQVQQFTFSNENLRDYQPPPPPPPPPANNHNTDEDENAAILFANRPLLAFDLGLGLHCCGSFTDMVMELCREQGADCIVCPCCNGGMKYTGGFQYPRSFFLKACMTQEEYLSQLSKSADHDSIVNKNNNHDTCHYAAKCWIEYDRALWAHEQGMDVELWKMTPVECTPKHHVLYVRQNK